MSYFVFDMDETLAEMYTVYYFLASLKLKETIDKTDSISEALEQSLKKAYKCFIIKILNAELASPPLGILRPGILSIMSSIANLYNAGLIKGVVIYSNNGHLESLEFIRDLIHTYVGSDSLIKDCIHWEHPMRNEERIVDGPNKTWPVLKNIMVNGVCGAPLTLEPAQVHFFDDLEHKNLQDALGVNYHKVTPYERKASFDQVANIYIKCVKDVDFNEFVPYIKRYLSNGSFNRAPNTIETVINIFRDDTDLEPATLIDEGIKTDEGIQIMKDVVDQITPRIGGSKRRRSKNPKRSKKVGHRLRKTARKN